MPDRPAGLLLVLVFALCAISCSATKALFRGATASEVGRDGWLKGGVSTAEIEAVRGTQRVVIAGGREGGTFQVRVDPRSLEIPTPPWGSKAVSVERTGANGEVRVYRIPPGHSWDDVRNWYLGWFDFKPAK